MASGSNGHVEEGCRTTHFSTLRVQVRPVRSIFSNALNFCRSAIAALVRSPCRYCPFRLAGGPRCRRTTEFGRLGGIAGAFGVFHGRNRECVNSPGFKLNASITLARQRIEGSCPLVWGHCLQDKLLGFRRVRNNIGNSIGSPPSRSVVTRQPVPRLGCSSAMLRQYARWPSPKLVP
jgi:hypothetical protein